MQKFDYVLDTNVIMSILISGKSSYKSFVMFNRFVTIDYLFKEIDEYKETIFDKSKLERNQLVDYTNHILSKITVLPRYVVNEELSRNPKRNRALVGTFDETCRLNAV